VDTSVRPLDDRSIEWAQALAVSVPMHTAMRLALDVAAHARSIRPDIPICFYGLYATAGSHLTEDLAVDQLIAGEYEAALVEWVANLATKGDRTLTQSVTIELGRGSTALPDRQLLPPLDQYAMLDLNGDQHLVGYVEASRGCRHRCRHCPVPVIYDGRVRVTDPSTVVADVANLVEAGARHITYGDPDFFNALPHSLKVMSAVHEAFPDLTFDCTIKVEHLIQHRTAIPDLAAAGCLFVVTAVESTSDFVLEKLDKGHVGAEAVEAIDLLRNSGIEMRPTFLPFTPWTTIDDMLDLCHFISDNDLLGNVDPVQMTIRLLVPEGSLLLGDHSIERLLGPFDPQRLTYSWTSTDPAVDQLHSSLVALLEKSTVDEQPPVEIFRTMWTLIHEAAGVEHAPPDLADGSVVGRPRMTEPWFC